jgi:hypothetical protein
VLATAAVPVDGKLSPQRPRLHQVVNLTRGELLPLLRTLAPSLPAYPACCATCHHRAAMAVRRGCDHACSGTLEVILIVGGGAGEGEDHAKVARTAGDLADGDLRRCVAGVRRRSSAWAGLAPGHLRLLAGPTWAEKERESWAEE